MPGPNAVPADPPGSLPGSRRRCGIALDARLPSRAGVVAVGLILRLLVVALLLALVVALLIGIMAMSGD